MTLCYNALVIQLLSTGSTELYHTRKGLFKTTVRQSESPNSEGNEATRIFLKDPEVRKMLPRGFEASCY